MQNKGWISVYAVSGGPNVQNTICMYLSVDCIFSPK